MTEPTLETPKTALSSKWNNWFYGKETPYALALIRITYPLALLIALVPRWLHVRELYSTDGAPTPFWWSYGYSNILPIFSAEVAMALYTVMILLLCSVSIGWKTRPSLVILALLVPYFGLLDTLATLTKYTAVTFHVFLLLSLSGCGAVWSVDAWVAKRRSANWSVPKFDVWPQRLIQLLIGFVYLGSAATKAHTEGFFTGDQMFYWALTNVNFPNPVGEWLTGFPSFIVISGMIGVVWEILFIFLVWKEPGRVVMLSLGVLFHLMTYFLLGLLVFPLLFFSLYCCYLKESEALKIGEFCSSKIPLGANKSLSRLSPLRLATWPAFACVMIASSVAAIAAERKLDVYQERGINGPMVLQPLEQEVVEEVFRNDTKVAIADQLYSIDVGSRMLGGYVAGQKTTFAAGETIQMQARLIPPHHDLWVEYVLRDADSLVIARQGMLAPRNDSKTAFSIPLGEQLEAGAYEIQVSLNGFAAGVRKITIQ
ncbi:HTTM domain-containing protein [bacterium]|jgi:hypothetical protein|nr:HTTM domain-containing protein [Planctomicrobium sp.]MDA7503994.1 HTTM domain-containing protein [bacterium]